MSRAYALEQWRRNRRGKRATNFFFPEILEAGEIAP